MNTPHAHEFPLLTEPISTVPKPDRRLRRVDVVEHRRATDRIWVSTLTRAQLDATDAATALRIPA